jgi:hypothetical protein
MRRLQLIFSLLFVLLLGGGAAYGLLALVVRALKFFSAFESEFAAALVATAGTVLIGVVTLVLTQRESKRRDIREAHRAQKVEVYKRFMETAVVDVLRQSAEGIELSEKELVERYQDFFFTFTADLIVWGSPGVLQAFRRFRSAAAAPEQQNALILMDEILREIRKDLGNSNWHITPGDLISTFLKDPEELKKLLK